MYKSLSCSSGNGFWLVYEDLSIDFGRKNFLQNRDMACKLGCGPFWSPQLINSGDKFLPHQMCSSLEACICFQMSFHMLQPHLYKFQHGKLNRFSNCCRYGWDIHSIFTSLLCFLLSFPWIHWPMYKSHKCPEITNFTKRILVTGQEHLKWL